MKYPERVAEWERMTARNKRMDTLICMGIAIALAAVGTLALLAMHEAATTW